LNTFYMRFYNEISVEPISVLHIMKNTIFECVVLTNKYKCNCDNGTHESKFALGMFK